MDTLRLSGLHQHLHTLIIPFIPFNKLLEHLIVLPAFGHLPLNEVEPVTGLPADDSLLFAMDDVEQDTWHTVKSRPRRDEARRFRAEPRGQDAVEGGGRAAPLEMAQDGVAGLQARGVLDVVG